MRAKVNSDNSITPRRFLYGNLIIFAITGLLCLRLWYIQIYKGDYYRRVSERNRIRKIEIPAERGKIFDRNGKVIVGNRPFYDLVLIPQYVKDREKTLKILSRILHTPVESFERRLRLGAGRPKYLPITLKRNLSLHEFSTIKSNRIFLPGVGLKMMPRRDYTENVPVHTIGYLGEIDQRALKRLNEDSPENKYLPGELIGKQGLESRWEKYLRGKNGYQLIQVDAFGRRVGSNSEMKDWDLPLVPATKGSDLELTLDMDLQKAAREAFKGKNGAVVIMDPRNGEVLAMVSEPEYDPTMYQRSLSQAEWHSLVNNPFKPLFDKTTGGEYIPGSVFKPIVAMAAIEEGVINTATTVNCPGHFTLGDQTFHCWDRGGHGIVNLRKALMKSCDVFFYQVGVELGVDKIAKYASALGLGKKLGLKINLERPGLVPTSAWKKLTYRMPWTGGDTPNIAIGQGYNLLTPIQMASLYATIANSGTVWKPYIVKRVTNFLGNSILEKKPEILKHVEIIKPQTYSLIRRYLKSTVMDPRGTGKNANVEGTTVAGKTGSAQVVSLKKNNKATDVSVKWKEHAIFTAFSPAEGAELAIAIISENDAKSGGGSQAAPVAKKIIETYLRIKNENTLLPKIKLGIKEEQGGFGHDVKTQ